MIANFLTALHSPSSRVCVGISSASGWREEFFSSLKQASAYIAGRDVDPTVKGIYGSLQPLKQDALSRKAANVAQIENLLFDFDRATHMKENASDAELEVIRTYAEFVKAGLLDSGWPEPIETMSGNGYGLIFPLQVVEATKQNEAVLKAVLVAIIARFPTNGANVEIDSSVYDLPRVTKVAGTMVRKYPETEGRPHRRAVLLKVPEDTQRLTWEKLRGSLPLAAAQELIDATEASPRTPLESPSFLQMKRLDFGESLRQAGWVFQTELVAEGLAHNYHGLADQRCLVQGSMHEGNGNPSNPKCSRFVVTRDFKIAHQCLDSDCRNVISKTRTALRALKLEHVILDEEEMPDDVDLYAPEFVDQPGKRLRFPESSMYGKAGALARKTECPLGYAYLSALTLAAGLPTAKRIAGGLPNHRAALRKARRRTIGSKGLVRRRRPRPTPSL